MTTPPTQPPTPPERRGKLLAAAPALAIAMLAAVAFVAFTASTAPAAGDDANADKPDGKTGPWLGVRVTPVPDAVSAHLPLDASERGEVGVMIRNIVVDGPADKAGCERYDVIIALDDKPVAGAIQRFLDRAGRLKPGAEVAMTVIRGGERAKLTLVVGANAPAASGEAAPRYKYPEAPSGVLRERRRFEGAVLTRGADGWRWRELEAADAAALGDLPPEMIERLQRFAAYAGPGGPTHRTLVRQGERTLEIIRDEQGGVTVKHHRPGADGEPATLVRTYASAKAFREADPKAFELQARLAADPLRIGDDGRGGGEEPGADVDEAGAAGQPDAGADDRVNAGDDAYADQRRQYEAFLEGYLEYLRERMDDPDAAGEGGGPAPMIFRALAEPDPDRSQLPRRQFTRHDSGRIDVRIRKPSGDLVLSFRDADALAERNPDLYKHYRVLVDDAD